MYDLTNMTNATGIQGQAIVLNNASNGMLGVGMMILIYIVLFGSFKRYDEDTPQVLVFTTLVGLFIGLLMWSAELLSWQFLAVQFGLLVLSSLVYAFNK